LNLVEFYFIVLCCHVLDK